MRYSPFIHRSTCRFHININGFTPNVISGLKVWSATNPSSSGSQRNTYFRFSPALSGSPEKPSPTACSHVLIFFLRRSDISLPITHTIVPTLAFFSLGDMLSSFPSLFFLLPSFSLAALAQEADSPSPGTRSSSLQDRQFIIEADGHLTSSTVITDTLTVTSTITSSHSQPTVNSLDEDSREDTGSGNNSIMFLPYPNGPPDPNSVASGAAVQGQDSPSLSRTSPTPNPSDSAAESSDSGAPQTPAPAAIAAAPPALKGPLVAAYYPDWESSVVSPESIDFSKFDWIDFAFVTLTKNLSLTFDDSSSPTLLSRLVNAAHSKGSKVKISIGGWDGSRCAFQ